MNRRRLLILISILVMSTALIAAVVIPSPEDLLANAMDNVMAVTDGHAVIAVEFDTPEESGSGVVEVWGQLDFGPNGEPAMRAVILESSMDTSMEGVTAVTDGTQFWLYHPEQETVVVGTYEEMMLAMAELHDGELGKHELEEHHEAEEWNPEEMDFPETSEEAVAELLKYFTVERNGRDTLGDRSAYSLRLIPIAEQMPDEVRLAGGFVNVWIDSADNTPLSVEYAEGSVGYFKATATDVQRNQGIEASLFTFDIPEGTTVVNAVDMIPEELPVEEAEEADLLAPTYLPEGAVLLESLDVRGAIVQRYKSDAGDFTIAYGPASAAPMPMEMQGTETAVNSHTATLYSEEGRTLLTWSADDVTFWVAGELTTEQAQQIAESLD